ERRRGRLAREDRDVRARARARRDEREVEDAGLGHLDPASRAAVLRIEGRLRDERLALPELEAPLHDLEELPVGAASRDVERDLLPRRDEAPLPGELEP